MSTIPGAIKNEGLVYKKLPSPETDASLFKLHTLAAFIGPRGSGKTNAVVLLAKRYLEDGSINRIFVISPTYDSNRIFDLLHPNPQDVYKNMHSCLQDIQAIIESVKEMVQEYETTKTFNQIHDKWKRFQSGKGPMLTTLEFNLMEKHGFKRAPDIPRPSPLLIIDDMSHSDLYTPSKKNSFINLCLRHRHLFKVGLSIFMLVQTFKTGIPKCLRQNIQQFFLWPTHDMSQLESMYDEFANLCTKEDFMDMYKRACKTPHNFMTVDMNASDSLLRFRKCFDTILLPESLLSEEEISDISNSSIKSKKRKLKDA